MDFYATDSDLLKQVEVFERNAKKFQAKREEAQEYCEKFADHIQLMRKDLLSLESNEDAVSLNDELKGITDIMRIFGIGLEESVMKEPTNINLADWSNLCLFRLAIIKRKLGTIKAIVDETKIPPNLFKLYAFLYKIYDFLNSGELDEYDIEAIEENEFFSILHILTGTEVSNGKLISEDSFEYTLPEQMPSPENSEKSERSGSENSKYDENSDSEHAKSKSESIKEKEESKNVEDEDKKENPESAPEKIISENKTSLDSPKGKDSKYSNTSPDSPNTIRRKRTKKTRKPRGENGGSDDERVKVNTPSPKKNREKAERGERKKKRPKKTEHLLKTEGTKESKSVENKRKIIEKKNSEKMLQQSKIKLENTKSAKFADKIVKFEGKNKPKDQENVKENKLAKSQAIPRDSKIKFNQTDSQPASPSPSPSPSPSDDGRPKKKSKLLSGLTNSPGSTRKRSLSLAFGTFKSKKSLLTPAESPVFFKGSLEKFKASGIGRQPTWIPRFVILKESQIECYSDEIKGTILEIIDLESISALSLVTLPNSDSKSEESENSPTVPQESSKNLEKFLKAQKKSKIPTKENIFQISTHSGDAHQFSSSSRTDILRWAIFIYSHAPSLASLDPSKSHLQSYLKELYLNSFNEESLVKFSGESWLFSNGKITCDEKSINYSWNGFQLQNISGENIGEGFWDGRNLSWNFNNQEFNFEWDEITSEFTFVNNQENQEENQLIWGWQPDRILLKSSTATSPKFWKFRKPVPPPVALFIELLSASASGQSFFDANTFNCPDLSSSGSVVKSVKIK